MPHRQTQVQIPNRRDNEPPASPDQLQRIRALTTGLSLHGFRFDYRKLGTEQAETILQQLRIMSEQQNNTAPPTRKKGPGCIASFAKATTALIVWAFILAAVAGGGYLIYWKMNQPPPETASTTAPITDDDATPDTPGKTSQSTIFEGLGVSDNNTPTDTTPDQPKPTPDTNTPTPNPEPTPPAAIADGDLAKQLVGLEKLLVSLSQYTRNDFAPDLRARSSQGMQNKLDAYPQALAALDRIDPTLSPRIRAAVDAFAAPTLDGPALREDIKSIRQAITDLQ